MSAAYLRGLLPRPTDRLPLGRSGLQVSPLCLGITQDPGTVPAAFEAGINFFFLTADLHWPLYEGLRRGLGQLLSRPSVRDQVVVAVVSYLDQPLFQALQFHEVVDAVPGLRRVDVLVAGAIPNAQSLLGRPQEGAGRYHAVAGARGAGMHGARAIGASFHDRATALLSLNNDLLDLSYIRYNAAHPGAATEIFPHLRPGRTGLAYNFKSALPYVAPERGRRIGLGAHDWLPHITDHYRFALSNAHIDGILCAPADPGQLHALLAALDKPALTPQEQAYMLWLSGAAAYG